jgi:hypothetical protein
MPDVLVSSATMMNVLAEPDIKDRPVIKLDGQSLTPEILVLLRCVSYLVIVAHLVVMDGMISTCHLKLGR